VGGGDDPGMTRDDSWAVKSYDPGMTPELPVLLLLFLSVYFRHQLPKTAGFTATGIVCVAVWHLDARRTQTLLPSSTPLVVGFRVGLWYLLYRY